MTTERAASYADRSRLYLANAAEMLRDNRPEKSSEFLWGAMAEALKALAAAKGIKLRTHSEIKRYARGAAKQVGDERLLDVFSIAETLHSNFYEGMYDMAQVTRHASGIREAVGRLLSFVPSDEDSTEQDNEA